MFKQIQNLKQTYFPDFTWWEIIEVILYFCWYNIIGWFNGMKTLYPEYPQYNLFQGRFRTGLINLASIYLLQLFFIEEIKLQIELIVIWSERKIQFNILTFALKLNLPTSCVDYWQNGSKESYGVNGIPVKTDSTPSASNLLQRIQQFLQSIQYEFQIHNGIVMINDELEVIIDKTKIEFNLQTHEYKVQLGKFSLNTIQVNQLQTNESRLAVVSLLNTNLTYLQSTNLLKFDLSNEKIRLQIEESSTLIMIQYLLKWKSMSYYSTDYLRDYFDDQFDQLLNRLESSRQRTRSGSLVMNEDEFNEYLQDYPHIDLHNDFYFTPQVSSLPVTTPNKRKIDIIVKLQEILLTVHSSPNQTISMEHLLFQDLQFARQLDAEENDFLKFTLNRLLTIQDLINLSVPPSSTPQVAIEYSVNHINQTQHKSFQCVTLPLFIGLSTKTINLLLWTSQELVATATIPSNLLFENEIDLPTEVYDEQQSFTWDRFHITISQLTVELWQEETVVETNYHFNEKMAMRINGIEIDRSQNQEALLHFSIDDLIVGALQGPENSEGNDTLQQRIVLLNVEGDIPFIKSNDNSTQKLKPIVPISAFQTFQEWDNFIVEASTEDPEILPNESQITRITVQQCRVDCSNNDFRVLSMLGTALNQHDSLRTVTVEREFDVFHATLLTASKIKVCFVSVDMEFEQNEQDRVHAYRFLHHQTIQYESVAFTNDQWTSTEITISSPLQIVYSLRIMKGDDLQVAVSDRLLMNLIGGTVNETGKNLGSSSDDSNISDETDHDQSLKIFMKSGLSQINWHVSKGIGLGALSRSFYLPIKDCSICVDIAELTPLLRCINHYSGNVYRIPYQRHGDQIRNTDQRIHFSISNKIFHKLPTAISYYSFQRMRITLLHLSKPVMITQVSTVQYSSVAFGLHLSQSSMECSSLQVGELSGDAVKHKLIIDNISADLKNKVSYHSTSRTGEYSLVEINAVQLQVLYVHRAWMTLVTFIRDYFIADLYTAMYSYPPPNPLPDYSHVENPKGLFRLGVMLQRSELHLPISSFAPDALAIVFHHLNFFCTNEYLSKYNTYLAYSMGPYLSKTIWMSEISNVKRFTAELHSTHYQNLDMFDIIDPELECRWKLAINAFQDELTCKLATEDDNQSQSAEWYMTVELYDATIASWCNRNALCNGQDISCSIRNRLATPNSEDPVEAIGGEEYHTASEEYRNTCIVDVLAEEIYWVLSQGQYWCIVNLIQQNFIEEYYHVKDPYIYPKWKTVTVNEEIYGNYALNMNLPLISTVPVHILKGRIICIDNDSDFYDLFVMDIPEAEIIPFNELHNFEVFLNNTVRYDSQHKQHRELCWSKWSSSANKRTAAVAPNTPNIADKIAAAYLRDREVRIDTETDAPFCVFIEQLELDFFRLHFGGGSGIEISATTFMVVAKDEDVKPENNSGQQARAPTSAADEEDDVLSQLSIGHYDSYEVKQIVLGPKDFADRKNLLHWTEKKPSAASAFGGGVSSKAFNKSPYHSYQNSSQKNAFTSNSRKVKPQRNPHIRYSQQSVDNMRRCIIDVDDSIVVAHFLTIMSIVDFFHTPIRVNDQRNLRLVEELGKGRNDWKAHMDVEVHVKNSVLGLPNIPATSSSTSAGGNQIDSSSNNNLCFELNLDYLHGWRGFIESGPGSATFLLNAMVFATFIAPVSELPTDRSCRMFDPVKIQFSNHLTVLPQKEDFERNFNLLKKWMSFDQWIFGTNKFPRASGSRIMKLTIDLVDEEEEEELSRKVKRKLSRVVEADDEDEEGENGDEDEDLSTSNVSGKDVFASHRRRRSLINELNESNRVSETADPDNPSKENEKNKNENEEEGERERERGSEQSRSRRDTQDTSGYLNKPKVKKITRGELSLKDVEFIISAISCFKGNMHRRVLRVPQKDPYEEISFHLSDIRFLPDLTYYLVYVDLPNGFKVDIKEFFSEFSDFEFMIRNNTYNLKLAKLQLSGIDVNYCRHPHNLHVASQVKASAWTFNDTIDEWEPLIEPIYMLAVAATDKTRGYSISLTNANKIQVKVETESLELNASQVAIDNLIRKIRLNDVVTTSSKRLPPYKIINELGIDLSFCVGYEAAIVVSDEIKPGETCPIEVSQLTDKLEDYKSRAVYSDRLETNVIKSMNQAIGSKEYLLWISFANFRDAYCSRIPLSIDRVGTTPFQMSIMNDSEVEMRKRQGSVVAFKESPLAEGGGGESTSDGHSTTTSLPSFVTQSHAGIKYAKELPLTLLDMKIKEDGVRELRIKSILSFRNFTHRLLTVSLRLYGSSLEMSVAPGKEWNVPVRYANPKTALFVRFDARTPWLEAASLGSFITSGYWGDPQRLKADILSCPTENSEVNENWTILLRPEVKSVKNTTSAVLRQSPVPIRYPNKESHRQRQNHLHAQQQLFSNEYSTEALDEITLLSTSASTSSTSSTSSNLRTKTSGIIRPLCIHLQAPLQLLNLLPQPILYRLATGDGHYFASGLIVSGQLIDLHNLPQLFYSKLFISVRMINYTWSKWTVLCSRTNPYITNERHFDLLLNSLHFQLDDKDFHLPSLEILMTVKEYLVRFSCQYVLSNCTGQPLLFADPSNYDLSLPIASNLSVTKLVEGNIPASYHYNNTNHANSTLNYRLRSEKSYINLNYNDFNDDDDDDTESSLYEEGSQAASSSNDPYLFSDSSYDGTSSPQKQDANSRANNGNLDPIIGITVYLPTDHYRKLHVIAAATWTLAELFNHVKHSFSSLPVHAQLKDYIFFPYQISKNNTSKAEVQELNNLVDEEVQTDIGDSSSVMGGVSVIGGSVIGSNTGKETSKGRDKEKEKDQPTHVSDHQDIPSAMRFDMIVDFSSEALLSSLIVANVPTTLILCHKTEYQIFEQSSTIQTIALEREGRFFKSMFTKTKYSHRANFLKIEGDFPFRPKKLLGFNAIVSLCIPNQTDWSTGIDFIKSDVDVAEMTIRVSKTMNNNNNFSSAGSGSERRGSITKEYPAILEEAKLTSSVFEFGAFVEKGRGIFHNTTIVTFVPKHIFYSRLSFDLDIRLIEDDKVTSVITLIANSSVNFHFPQHMFTDSNMKTFQVRYTDGETKPLQQQQPPPPQTLLPDPSASSSSDWIGEFDITVLGIFYAKLVINGVKLILKIETELVGASYITTFREQNIQWPPYRIDNMTDYKIKFRQSMSDSLSSAPSTGSLSAPVPERRPSYDPFAMFNNNNDDGSRVIGLRVSKETKWDEVQPGSCSSYCWDYPLTGFKLLHVEVSEGKQSSKGIVSLDDDSKIETLTLIKSVPNIGNPLAADELLMNAMDGTETSTILGMAAASAASVTSSANSQWIETYCIVRPDIVYVYRKTKDSLVKVINLSLPTGYSEAEGIEQENEKNSVGNTLPKFAVVSKYIDKGWDIMGTVSSTVGFIGSMIGSATGNKGSSNIASATSASGTGSTATGAQTASLGGLNFDLNSVRRMILLLADQMGLFANCSPETFNLAQKARSSSLDDEFLVNSPPPPPVDESQIRLQSRRRSLLLRSIRPIEEQLPPQIHSLQSLLQAKISVDQLLDEVCNYPIRLTDFLIAAKDLNFVDGEEKALEFFVQMYSAGYISTIEGGSTIHGGASGGLLARDTSESPESTNSTALSREISQNNLTTVASDEGNYSNNNNNNSNNLKTSNLRSLSMVGSSNNRDSISSSPGLFGNLITDENYFDEKVDEKVKDIRRYSIASDSGLNNTSSSAKRLTLPRSVTHALGFPLPPLPSVPPGVVPGPQVSRRKLQGLIDSFENIDLFFNAPSIVGEFIENMNQAPAEDSSQDQADTYGVTIYLSPVQKYHFKCSSYLAYCGWIQACRNAIEQSFVDYIIHRTNPAKRKEKPVSIEEYQVNIVMKVRADGSTKVLEILEGEIEPARVNRTFASSLSSLIRGKKATNASGAIIAKKRKAFARAAILMPFLSGKESLMIKHRSTSSKAIVPPTETEENNAPVNVADDSEQELINVSFHVNSVSLSVVDATPYEILYLRLDNINMKVLRFVDSVQFTVAVEQIDISNQLLSPSFPVALFARKKNKDQTPLQRKFTLVGYQEMNLPSRNANENPALYLHMHQRYHKNPAPTTPTTANTANNHATATKEKNDNHHHHHHHNNKSAAVIERNDIRLWYFDIFTLWLTPLQLALEEEFMVRLFRFIQGLRNAVVSQDSKRSRKLKEDELYVTSPGAPNSGNLGASSMSSATPSANASGGNNAAGGSGSHPNQHHSTRMVELDAYTVYDIYTHFMESGRRPYQQFKNMVKSSLHLYFNTLQLHPLDIAFYFRPSPGIQVSNAELALLSVISQLDSSRLCLNALFAQHAYGSSSLITEILVKHYRTSFWRQFHRLLSGVEPIDNTVGLVANVGGGVYDLSYEYMNNEMDGESLNPSSKVGVSSLASKALVGTSAITSKIAGGLGKGVSLLTLDMEFQRTRGYRRYVKASTVSEGIIVGTQELGKNIVEGVTGVVVAPMKGWETGGGVGFGVGVAKGVLGFALKPAVGVFDLASRATEGLRNTASTNADGGIVTQLQTIHRTRIPRAFGRSGLMNVYDAHAAAAQYMADSLTGFKYETRIIVIAHLFHKRKLQKTKNPGSSVFSQARPYSMGFAPIIRNPRVAAELATIPTEIWGMKVNTFYLTIVCPDRVALMQLSTEETGRSQTKANKRTSSTVTSSVARPRKLYRKWIWSCPSHCIEQLRSDSGGDLIITTNQHLSFSPHNNNWLQSNFQPTILDLDTQNYFIFQALLEQSIGMGLARQHPLFPKNQGYFQGNIKKRYVSGIRSYILSPTTHVYRIFGNVLYEYTKKSSKKKTEKASSSKKGGGGEDAVSPSGRESDAYFYFNPDESNSEEYAEHLIYNLFPTHPRDRHSDDSEDEKKQRSPSSKQQQQPPPPTTIIEEVHAERESEKGVEGDKGALSSLALDPLNSSNESEEQEQRKELPIKPEEESIVRVEDDTASQASSSVIDQGRVADIGLHEDLEDALFPVDKEALRSVDQDGESNADNEETTPTISHQTFPYPRSPSITNSSNNTSPKQPSTTTQTPLSSRQITPNSTTTEIITEDILEKDYYLSFVYPLVDLFITGPNSEENGKLFSITISLSSKSAVINNLYNNKMRVIKRDDENEQFIEYRKNGLSLLFSDYERAKFWRDTIADRIIETPVSTLTATAATAAAANAENTYNNNHDLIPIGPLKPEDRSNYSSKLTLSRTSSAGNNNNNNNNDSGSGGGGGGSIPVNISSVGSTNPMMGGGTADGSILSLLVIPTAAGKPEETERIKIEIARIRRI